jgi:hypothetical protein
MGFCVAARANDDNEFKNIYKHDGENFIALFCYDILSNCTIFIFGVNCNVNK